MPLISSLRATRPRDAAEARVARPARADRWRSRACGRACCWRPRSPPSRRARGSSRTARCRGGGCRPARARGPAAAKIVGQLSSSENMASWLDTSTACPRPVRARARRARASTPMAPNSPCDVVAERAAAARRRVAGKARERHEAARRLRDDVVRGPIAPTAPSARSPRGSRRSSRGCSRHEVRRGEPPARQRAAGEVLDQHVEVRQQAAQERRGPRPAGGRA